jgi:hypothetical protein
MSKPIRRPSHRGGLLVSEDQLQLAEMLARELRLVNSGIEYDLRNDESWLRIAHRFLTQTGRDTHNMQELHLILFCHGREVKPWPPFAPQP